MRQCLAIEALGKQKRPAVVTAGRDEATLVLDIWRRRSMRELRRNAPDSRRKLGLASAELFSCANLFQTLPIFHTLPIICDNSAATLLTANLGFGVRNSDGKNTASEISI